MKAFDIFLTTLALTALAFAPAAVLADEMDELDVMMEVMTDEDELDDFISEMRGPDDGDLDDALADDDDLVEGGDERDGLEVEEGGDARSADEDGDGDFIEEEPVDQFEDDLVGEEDELSEEDAFEREDGDDISDEDEFDDESEEDGLDEEPVESGDEEQGEDVI